MITLLYHCPAGISGDMNLGAMIDLGVKPDLLECELRKLPLEGWSLKVERDKRNGISGTRCSVLLNDNSGPRKHSHASHKHHNSHHHRTFRDIRKIISESALSKRVKADALACFKVLAEAEGKVHGIDPEQVHFHEVGAIDSIIDMVGAAICWELMEVDSIAYSTLELGGGTVKCTHGLMPVPAPATARIAENMITTWGATDKEATTPTGAALLKGRSASFAKNIRGRLRKNGIGIGQRKDPNLANVVYVSLLETTEAGADWPLHAEKVFEISVNLDDMTAEATSFLRREVLDKGALDVWEIAAQFKKGRTGLIISALVKPSDLEIIRDVFLKHSSTLGVRYREWDRYKLERCLINMETPWGTVRVKQATHGNKFIRQKPDFDDCARIALNEGISLAEVETKLYPYLKRLKEAADGRP